MKKDERCAVNTDREIWRERPGDYYADSIFVTKSGAIGISCGGLVIVAPVRKWHLLAVADDPILSKGLTPKEPK